MKINILLFIGLIIVFSCNIKDVYASNEEIVVEDTKDSGGEGSLSEFLARQAFHQAFSDFMKSDYWRKDPLEETLPLPNPCPVSNQILCGEKEDNDDDENENPGMQKGLDEIEREIAEKLDEHLFTVFVYNWPRPTNQNTRDDSEDPCSIEKYNFKDSFSDLIKHIADDDGSENNKEILLAAITDFSEQKKQLISCLENGL